MVDYNQYGGMQPVQIPQEEESFLSKLNPLNWDIKGWFKAGLAFAGITFAANKSDGFRNVLNTVGKPFDTALGEHAAEFGKNFDVFGSKPNTIDGVASFSTIGKAADGSPTFDVNPSVFLLDKKKVEPLRNIKRAIDDTGSVKYTLSGGQIAENEIFREQEKMFSKGYNLFKHNEDAEKFIRTNETLIAEGKVDSPFIVDLSKMPTVLPKKLEDHLRNNAGISNYDELKPIEKLEHLNKMVSAGIKDKPDFEKYAFNTGTPHDLVIYNLPDFMSQMPLGPMTVEEKERNLLLRIKNAMDAGHFDSAKDMAEMGRDYFAKEGLKEKKDGKPFKQYTAAEENFDNIAKHSEYRALHEELQVELNKLNGAIIDANNAAHIGAKLHMKNVEKRKAGVAVEAPIAPVPAANSSVEQEPESAAQRRQEQQPVAAGDAGKATENNKNIVTKAIEDAKNPLKEWERKNPKNGNKQNVGELEIKEQASLNENMKNALAMAADKTRTQISSSSLPPVLKKPNSADIGAIDIG